jgi:hypothetical protein
MLQNDSDLDETFEQALASYADPLDMGQPEVLTSRVLATLESARRRRRRWKVAFMVAMPEFALIVVWMAFLLPHRRQHVDSTQQTGALSRPPAASAPIPQAVASGDAPAVPHAQTTHTATLIRKRPKLFPKLDQFPTPTPPSEQEQLLANFVRYTPVRQQQTLLQTQKQTQEPLHIADLSIAPIDLNTQP